MKIIFTIFFSILLAIPCFSQQDLLPAFSNEIRYQDERAYYNGSPFTGLLLVDENSKKKMGEFRNGYKFGLFTDFYADGIKKSEGRFVNGIKEEVHIEWYRNGNKKSEGYYSQDIIDGPFEEYYQTGNKKSQGTFAKGIKNGYFTEYYENGNKQVEGEFVSGQKNGLHASYFNNLIKENEIEYLLDKRNGSYKEWYENAKMKLQAEYISDQLNGIFIEYFENGNIKYKYQNKDDKKDGVYEERSETGKLIKEIPYSNDIIADGNVKVYDSLGELNQEVTYQKGVIISEYFPKDQKSIIFKNGNKESEGTLKDGIKEGFWIEYYAPTGDINSIVQMKKFEGYYANGKREGEGKEYSEKGDMKWNGQYKNNVINGMGTMMESDGAAYTGIYTDGIKEGEFSIIYPNGIKAEGIYIGGKKNDLWTEWYSNGNKKSEIPYTNDQIINGTCNLYYENGKLSEVKNYLDGKLSYSYTKWYDNGVKEMELFSTPHC